MNPKDHSQNGPGSARDNAPANKHRDPRVVLEAMAHLQDGASKAAHYVRAIFTSHKAQEKSALAGQLATAKDRAAFLATEIPRMEQAKADGTPYLPSDHLTTLPPDWPSRLGLTVLSGGLAALEVSTCLNVMSIAEPLLQSKISALAMAAPIAVVPFAVKLFNAPHTAFRISLAILAVASSCTYASLFASVFGAPVGDALNLAPVLASQLIAETLGLAAISAGITRLMIPRPSALLHHLIESSHKEAHGLAGEIERLEVLLSGLKAAEDADAIEAESIVASLKESNAAEENYFRRKQEVTREVAARFFKN